MRRLLLTASATVMLVTAASGQEIISAKAGLIHLLEGKVLINGVEAEQKGDEFLSLKDGDILSTEHGRAEVLLNAGSYLRVSESTSFKLTSSYLEDTRLTVLAGTALIEVAELPKDTAITVDFLNSQVELKKRGLYEFTADATGRARVYDGEIVLKAGSNTPVRINKGREIALNQLIAGPVKFDQTSTTALYRWGARRARYIADANYAAARTGSYTSSGTGFMPGFRGGWVYNPMFGMFTYLPLSGYGYSPFGGVVLYSPTTALVRYATPVINMGSGFDSSSGARNAVSSPAYATGVPTSGGAPALPATTAPLAPPPNVGGGNTGVAVHRR